MRLHRRYRRDAFDPRLIMLTKVFYRSRPWSGSDEERQRKYYTWLHGACHLYDLPQLTLHYDPPLRPRHALPIYGVYIPAGRNAQTPDQSAVILRRWSVVSMFHQFRHHMQAHSVSDWDHDRMGQDAQEWSTSLFYITAPRSFRRAVEAGRIAGIASSDLQ